MTEPTVRAAVVAAVVVLAVLAGGAGPVAGALLAAEGGRAQPGGPAPGGGRKAFQARFIGKPAPDFDLPDTAGRKVRLSALRGRTVLVNFWYSSCYPCRKETPDLIELRRRYKDRGFEVIGVNLDSILMPQAGREGLRRFLEEFKVSYPVVLADIEVFEDYGAVPVQPLSFLIDRGGKVVRIFWGAVPGAALERTIAPYLNPAGPPAPPPPARP